MYKHVCKLHQPDADLLLATAAKDDIEKTLNVKIEVLEQQIKEVCNSISEKNSPSDQK